ncbi:uncharacterized protein [Haliotis cracherodii]|uniref:uncharacterized protein n=1 Tax=Haliotis cracherodii TaxID=6455 RepID=UPI0039ED084B
MNSHLPIQILLLLVTSFCESRPSPRDCGRKFHFDFERQEGHPPGGIWQGLEGRVTFRGGKAWLDGHGSLIYPFFSHNDLRTGFAFSFKIKPAKIAPGGRVAIITNGVDPGSSTLTVFHNGTCLGVKVVEIAETWNPAKGIDFSRNVELSVEYTKHKQRLKRSSDTGATADVYVDPNQSDDDMTNVAIKNDTTGSLETIEKLLSFISGEVPGNHGDAAGVPDDGPRDDNGASTTNLNYDIIAVRKLFKEDTTNTHSSAYHVDIVTETPSITTTAYRDITDTQSSTTTSTDGTDTQSSTTTSTDGTDTQSTTTTSDITKTASTTMYSDTTEIPSTSTYSDIIETPSTTTTYSGITEVPSTTTYSDITETASTTTYSDNPETASTTTYNVATDTPSTTCSDNTETIEDSDTDNGNTISDFVIDTNSSTLRSVYTSSGVSDHTATPLTESDTTYSTYGARVREQTTQTPHSTRTASTTDFVVYRLPSTYSVHIYTDAEQTTIDPASNHMSSGVSLSQQTTTLPSTTSRVPQERVVVPKRNRFLIIPNIFKGLQEEDPDEIEVRLAQDNGVLRLQVGESAIQETTVGVTEHMKAPRSALRVGTGDGLLSYKGSFDEFSMYDCAPEKFFKDEN